MKRLIRKAMHNIDSRDEALLYINGNILIGKNHPVLIREYLSQFKSVDEISDSYIMDFSEYERKEKQKTIENMGLAFAHIIYDEVNNDTDEEYDVAVYLETSSIVNTTVDEVVSAIKLKLGDVPIFDDDSHEEIGGFADKYKRVAAIK